MRLVALVPMKLNNERVKGKNTRRFDNGKPLCSYILNTLKSIDNLDDIYVYCSDESIKEYIPDGIKYLKRSSSLDGSEVKINDVLKAFSQDVDSDYYLLTHATAPFISKESIEKGINVIKEGKYDSVLTVLKVQNFFWKDNKAFNYELNSIPRTQDLEPFYEETSGLYIYSKDLIMNKNRRIGFNPYLLEISKIEALDIDTEDDFFISNAVSSKLDMQTRKTLKKTYKR